MKEELIFQNIYWRPLKYIVMQQFHHFHLCMFFYLANTQRDKEPLVLKSNLEDQSLLLLLSDNGQRNSHSLPLITCLRFHDYYG